MCKLIGLLLIVVILKMGGSNNTAIIPIKLLPLMKRNGAEDQLVKEGGKAGKWRQFSNGACNFPIHHRVRSWRPLRYLKRIFEESKEVCNAAYENASGMPIERGLELVVGNNGQGVPVEALAPKLLEVKTVADRETGCHCVSDLDYECVCCVRASGWFFCQSVGLSLADLSIFLITTVEDTVVFEIKRNLHELLHLLEWCIPLPPPVEIIELCVGLSFEAEVPQYYKLCGDFKVSIFWVLSLKLFSLCQHFDFRPKWRRARGGTESLENRKVNVTMVRANPSDGVVTVGPGEVYDDTLARTIMLYGSSRKIRSVKALKDPNYKVPWVKEAIDIKERINWEPSYPEETSYFAVLYAHKKGPVTNVVKSIPNEYPTFEIPLKKAEAHRWLDNTHHHVSFPGGSCGAAILTINKLLTNCGCIRTFYIINKLRWKLNVIRPKGFDIQAENIFVQIAQPLFDLDEEYYSLDKNPDNFMTQSACVDGIVSNASQAYLETTMIVMTFKPDLKDEDRQFVDWPPITTEGLPDSAGLMSIGLEPHDPHWRFIDDSMKHVTMVNLEVTPVDYFLKKCTSKYCDAMLNSALTDLQETLTGALKERTSCYCAQDAGYQLWNGVIGFPIVADNRLIGLSSTWVEGSHEGSLLGTFFDKNVIFEIEKHIGSSVSSNYLRVTQGNFIFRCIFLPVVMFISINSI